MADIIFIGIGIVFAIVIVVIPTAMINYQERKIREELSDEK